MKKFIAAIAILLTTTASISFSNNIGDNTNLVANNSGDKNNLGTGDRGDKNNLGTGDRA